ncbi:MAG: alpha/beta hydrolase [Opitutales bacterium]
MMSGVVEAKTSSVHEVIDLAYGKHERQKLDVVWSAENKASPVVIFFHGGSWRWGVKDFYRDIGKEFAKQGVTFVVANYRLYPEVRFPAFVEDAARVVKWTRQHIGRYGGKPDAIFLMGHSSGAHIVSHLALNESYIEAVGGDFSWIKGVIGLSGPYTFQPSEEWLYNDVFHPLSKSPKVVPISLVDGDEPPFLVLHGRHDYLVDVKQAEAFVQRIEEKGGEVTKRIFHLHGHFSMMRRITSWYFPPKGILHEVLDFVEDHT